MTNRIILFFVCGAVSALCSTSLMGQDSYSALKHAKEFVGDTFEQEYRIGLEWLKSHMEDDSMRDSVRLEIYKETKEWVLFNDRNRRAFVLVATSAYWSESFSPVLAWSTENAYFYNELQNKNTDVILQNFSKQLRHIQSVKEKDSLAVFDHAGSFGRCAPLLGLTRWGQGNPYNSEMPIDGEGKHTPVGCVPVAVSQLLRFFEAPIQKGSSIHYKDVTEKVYSLKFDEWQPDWKAMRDSYDKDDTTASEVSDLLMIVGLGVNARYGVETTSADLGNVRTLLCNNFGFSASMRELYNSTDSILLSHICQNLNQQRPSIVSWNGHVFIVDGGDSCYLHYNLGWGGYCNGWYQPLLWAAQDDSEWGLIRAAVVGIEPRRTLAKSVHVDKAGTLSSLLAAEELSQITHLRLSGKINGEDIRLLRKMAGSENRNGLTERKWGNLMDLDLSDANIVKNSKEYYSEPATDTWTRNATTTYRSGSYKSSNTYSDKYDLREPMDEKEWKEFSMTIGTKHDGKFYTRDEEGKITVHYNTEEDVLGYCMFDHCVSLQRLILPKSTTLIRTRAIYGCPLLLNLVIPAQVGGVQNNGITCCHSLERVDFLNFRTRCKPQNFFQSSPVFKKVVH